jgi:ATPase family AAA domain-containing protein 3A/B
MVEGIKNVSSQIALLVRNIFAHPQQLLFLAGIILGLITGYFFIREVSNLIRQFIQANIGKPVLVRETSYHFSLLPSFLSLDSIFPNRMNNPDYLSASLRQLEEEFRDIILGKDDKSRVINLALATRNTKRSGAPYRHVLLHGEPGTGKTLVARKLAQCSGMDYAILSGGDVAPLGEDAVTQLHSLFRWAKRSKKGLLVFIDEAEAFLSSRSHIFGDSGVSDTHTRNALNALLYQTGTPSTNFMMILATNRPEDLDSAILDRIDVSIQISLPKLEERKDLVKLYMKLHLKQVIAQRQFRSSFFQFFLRTLRMLDFHYKLDEKCDHEDNLNLIARRIEGFSGREISKMFISAQYAMFLAPNRYLSWELLEDVVKTKIKEHLVKVNGFRSVVASDAKSALK